QKGVLGTLAQALIADTSEENDKDLQRADLPFQKYRNRVIRSITINPLQFGVRLSDTAEHASNALTRLANQVHYDTRNFVLRNYLFFQENDRLSPYLLGNNERYLRDLPFLQEANIKVKPVKGSPDSVDVMVYTKDVLSIGGSLSLRNSESGRIEIKEDNFMGWGDRLQLQTLYDKTRQDKFGFGAEYIKRNILGSYIDGSGGYINFHPAFNSGRAEETVGYIRFEKPLVNPYMRFTYAASAEVHATANMFNLDSVYHNDLKYKYRVYDAWAGWNINIGKKRSVNEFERLRFLVGVRALHQKFLVKPLQYKDRYYYPYANLSALLTSVSVFKLNFYKTQYIYGFGRKEDIPEGLEASFTTGWTKKEGRRRPYFGFSFDQYFLTKSKRYIDYSFSAGAFLFQKKLEDVNLLATIDYFSRLRQLGTRWKQRSFLSFNVGRQFSSLLDEPLLMESNYGLEHFKNNFLGGYTRATMKGESVFFSPWSVLFFKFAPFVFSSATLFQYHSEVRPHNTRLYTALGGGIRTRNESLIFGTIELRGAYFPRKDAFNNSFIIQLNTNLRFKYNQEFIRRPDFVRVN
ncbi:MAG TPA: hypothetical protein VFS22_00670, partial [Flavisolibacter sp.]|nr:hypothetical protein [Flavisolibacter sp.]